ncbi:MAG: metal-dependent hydrolase [Acidobacteriota bacterium]
MEPLAHTLAGACLAEAGLKRVTPLAATTLIIAANIPDIDGACYLSSADVAFGFRRGWTHGVLAWFVLPVVLTLAMLAFDRLIRRRRDPAHAAARSVPLLALSVLGVLTHPFLDWLNTYGIRLLMPISDRWFYGDTLFIVDPWLWLLFGGGAAFGWSRTRGGAVATALLATAMTALVWGNPLVPAGARLAWGAGLAGWLLVRRWLPAERVRLAARVLLVLGVIYISMMFVGSRLAESRVRDLAAQRGWDADRIAAMPQPLDPWRRTVIAVTPQAYWFVPVVWPRGSDEPAEAEVVSRGTFGPVVAAALNAPHVQGVRVWLRFPSYEVQPRRDGSYRVLIRDARFAVGRRPGFGVVAIVDLDRDLKPMGP